MTYRRGFTLPEVLATIVLIGLAMPAVMRAISLSLAASDDARNRLQALALAERKLSEVSESASYGLASTANTTGDFGPELPRFRWMVATGTASVGTNLTELHVRVVWTSRGVERSVDLSTLAHAAGTTVTTGGTPGAATGGGT